MFIESVKWDTFGVKWGGVPRPSTLWLYSTGEKQNLLCFCLSTEAATINRYDPTVSDLVTVISLVVPYYCHRPSLARASGRNCDFK